MCAKNYVDSCSEENHVLLNSFLFGYEKTESIICDCDKESQSEYIKNKQN